MSDVVFKTRAESLREARDKKMREWFEGRHWKIIREFRLDPPQVFQTPFGHKGRHGFVIEEVDGVLDGSGPLRVAWGLTVLKDADRRFGAIENMPVPRRRGRPRKDEAPPAEVIHIGDRDKMKSGEYSA